MSHADIITLLIGALLLVSWVWRPRLAPEQGVWMLLIAYALLGAWALWIELYSETGPEPAGFLFWKPTILYWTLAIILAVSPALGWGHPVKAIFGTYFVLTNKQWRWMNRGLAALCAVLGGVNLLVAFNTAEGNWTGHKFSTMVILLMFILFRMTFVWVPTMMIITIKLYRLARTLIP